MYKERKGNYSQPQLFTRKALISLSVSPTVLGTLFMIQQNPKAEDLFLRYCPQLITCLPKISVSFK